MALMSFCLMDTLIITFAVGLYVITSVAGCGWPISFGVSLSDSNYLVL